jgi:hypothetical protein
MKVRPTTGHSFLLIGENESDDVLLFEWSENNMRADAVETAPGALTG